MRVECKCCHKRFDIPNREVLAMAAKLQAGKQAPKYRLPFVATCAPREYPSFPRSEEHRRQIEEGKRLAAAEKDKPSS